MRERQSSNVSWQNRSVAGVSLLGLLAAGGGTLSKATKRR